MRNSSLRAAHLAMEVGPLRAGQDGHDGDDHHADQGLLAIDGGPWVLQFLEMPYNLVQTDPPNLHHRSLSVGYRKTRYTENDIQTVTPRKADSDSQDYPVLALALTSVADLRSKLLNFIAYFNEVFAKPFHWTYTGRPLRVKVAACNKVKDVG